MEARFAVRHFLPITAAALVAVLAAGTARADVTYNISTTRSYIGTITGSVTGNGENLDSWNITATDGLNTFVFSDQTPGFDGQFYQYFGYTDASGNPISQFYIDSEASYLNDNATLEIFATGDFDTGLHYIGTALSYLNGQPVYDGGIPAGVTGPANVQDYAVSNGAAVVDDLAFAPAGGATAVPEPASLAVLAAGIAGLAWCRRVPRRRLAATGLPPPPGPQAPFQKGSRSMRTRGRLLLGVAFPALLLVQQAYGAGTIELKKSAEPFRYDLPGRALDVLGISPGMSLADARTRVAAEYGAEPAETRISLSVTYRGIQVGSAPYVSALSASKGDDNIVVDIGTPETGSVVVGVTRRLVYADALKAPLETAFFKAVDEKYGDESTSNHGRSFSSTQDAVWMYNGNKQVQCAQFGCFNPTDHYAALNVGFIQDLIAREQRGLDIGVSVMPARDDKTRAWIINVYMSDRTNQVSTLQEATKQLQQAGAAAYGKTAVPQNGPRL